MKKLLTGINRNQQGFVLLMTLLIMALGMVIIPAAFMFINTGSSVQQKQQERTEEVYAADAGAENGIWWVTKADHTSDALPATIGAFKKMDLVSVGTNKVQTYITYIGKVNGQDTYKVQGYGGANVQSNTNPTDQQPGPYTLSESKITLSIGSIPLFSNAVGALNGNIILGSSTIINSSPTTNDGNMTANGNITLGSSATVNGSVDASGNITKGSSANIVGASSPNDGTTNFSSIDTSPYLADVQLSHSGTIVQGSSYSNGGSITYNNTLMQGNLNMGSSKVLTVTGNLYVENGSITIGSSSKLIVNGKLYVNSGSITTSSSSNLTLGGTLYASGNLQTGSSSVLKLGGTVWVGGGITLASSGGLSGPYIIVAHDNITFNSSSNVGASQMPVIISTNGSFNFGSSVTVSGYLYAPTADANIGSSVTINGSIVAKSVTFGSSCHVTFITNPRSGLPGSNETPGAMQVVSWQITQN